MIEADRQPGILARELRSMFQTTREVAGLSYDQAAARLCCEPDWLVRVESDLYDLWARIESASAADPAQSRTILERHQAALS